MVYLPDYVEYQYVAGQPLRTLFPMASDDALNLLSKMFAYDLEARISAQQLEYRYFTSSPPATEPALLPRPPPKKESNNSKAASDYNPNMVPMVQHMNINDYGFNLNSHHISFS